LEDLPNKNLKVGVTKVWNEETGGSWETLRRVSVTALTSLKQTDSTRRIALKKMEITSDGSSRSKEMAIEI
jgi:hypothetical protein